MMASSSKILRLFGNDYIIVNPGGGKDNSATADHAAPLNIAVVTTVAETTTTSNTTNMAVVNIHETTTTTCSTSSNMAVVNIPETTTTTTTSTGKMIRLLGVNIYPGVGSSENSTAADNTALFDMAVVCAENSTAVADNTAPLDMAVVGSENSTAAADNTMPLDVAVTVAETTTLGSTSNIISPAIFETITNNNNVNVVRAPKRSRTSSNNASSSSSPPPLKIRKKQVNPRPSREEILKIAGFVPPELPSQLVEKVKNMGCDSPPKLVMQKYLHASDVNSHQGRLMIPKMELEKHNALLVDGFNEEEKKHLIEGGGIRVRILLETSNEEEEEEEEEMYVSLSSWSKPKDVMNKLVLTTEWNNVREKAGLEKTNVIQLWSFRYGEQQPKLGFVLLKVKGSVPVEDIVPVADLEQERVDLSPRPDADCVLHNGTVN
ncbi:uncharacterized protein [Spinacia oleracea]|uniref:DUF4283 domain-containing protein n=1 Tax=Spinacia oleracea TaxID=3562 RepID=A0ABM3QUM0_SPIOL|nr:uncharacterized protein LOC130462565 [Spinacia oleracea]